MNEEIKFEFICKTHNKQVILVCSNIFCKENRLVCQGCIKEKIHSAHQDNMEEVKFIQQNLQNIQQSSKQLINELNFEMEEIQKCFNAVIQTIESQYKIYHEKIKKLDSESINQAFQILINFQQEEQKILENWKKLFNKLKKEIQNFTQESSLQTSMSLYDQGLALYWDRQDYGKAIELLDRSLELDPNNYKSISLKGSCLRSMKKINEAIELYQKALQIDSKYVPSLSGIGLCLRIQAKFSESIVWYKKVIEIDQIHLQSYVGIGECLRMMEQFEQSIEWYDKALAIDPKDPHSLAGKGCSLRMMNKFEDSIIWYSKALDIDSQNIFSLSGKGDSLRMLNQLEEAMQCFNQVLEKDPNNYFCLGSKGACLMSLSEFNKAEELLKKSLIITPNYDFSKIQLKRCQEAKKDK